MIASAMPEPPVAARRGANLLRLAGIVEESIADGPGLRFVIFTQGCPHSCRGCHNPETHSLEGGSLYSVQDLLARYAENPLLGGVTFSGGEPFLQARRLCAVAEGVRAAGGNVMTYTGYTYETLLLRAGSEEGQDWARLLALTDLLVDGPYVERLRDLELPFRGSSNQRLLDRNARRELAARFHAMRAG